MNYGFKNEYFEKNDYLDEIKGNPIVNALVNEIRSLQNQVEIQSTDILYLNQQISGMSQKLMEYTYLLKAVAKDYPELVIAKPNVFLKDLKKRTKN